MHKELRDTIKQATASSANDQPDFVASLELADQPYDKHESTSTPAPTAATPLGEEGGPQGTFFLANCGGATGKSIAFEADTANNEVTITNVGAGIPGAYTLETWTFLPVPTTAVLRYDDGDGEFLAQFCLIDPRNPDGITVPDGIDTDTVLPLNEQTGSDPDDRHTTCIVQETKTTLGQFDFGTGIKAKFILFSTGDATRSFR